MKNSYKKVQHTYENLCLWGCPAQYEASFTIMLNGKRYTNRIPYDSEKDKFKILRQLVRTKRSLIKDIYRIQKRFDEQH